eukprot:TRINITY_DN24861_c0_g1_i1.p1 TRINITY_DN24861_c0_g1~~TRINITY_DN24861_c0_g1_i1.p1  ORF type:complete len:553 (+),score=160.94 TRINITY_DN24861_c0_g1_i1:48-1661(+)
MNVHMFLALASLLCAASCITVSSVNGVLEVTLVMDVQTFRLPDGSEFRTRVYNKSIPGPMLRVMPGDLLKVTLVNNLQGDADGELDTFRRPNTTNLHLHGLHVSPVLPGDDVSVAILPGQYRTYEYNIPSDHAPGLHWYHAHYHGSAALHVFSGAYGLIRVLGDEGIAGTLPTYTMPIQYMHWTGEDSNWLSGNSIPLICNKSRDNVLDYTKVPQHDVWLVGGEVMPVYKIRQCESTRLSIAFTSAGSQLNLTMAASNCGKCEMQLISRDGHQLHRYPRAIDGPVFVPAGGRVDVLVRCTAVCNYTLQTDDFTLETPVRELASFQTVPSDICAAAITPLSVTPAYPAPLYARDLRRESVPSSNKLVIQLIDGKGCRYRTESPEMGVKDFWFAMDHEKDVRHKTPLGSVHEVTLLDSINHPFHMHVSPFQIMSGSTEAARGNFETGDWADTVQFTEMVFRTKPMNFVGYQMFHCHVLSHEDQGCMAEIEITPAVRRDSLAGHFAFHPLLPVFLLIVASGAIGIWTLFAAPAGRGYKTV